MTAHERMFRHHHAHKLDNPERQQWLPVDAVLQRLAVRPGMRVADIGAGTGYFALPLARAVLPGGRIFAVDMQPEMLDLLRARLAPELPVVLVEGEATRTTLADASVDLVFIANVWHELDDRTAALAEASRILRPGGRLALLDWRADVAQPPGPPLAHRVPQPAVAALLQEQGWSVDASEPAGSFSYLVLATRA